MRVNAGIMLLVACASQAPLQIDDVAFSQERMAHSVGIGTMYLNTTKVSGNHNCDDAPSGCCASGYHLCTSAELLNGGREIEDSGTGRLAVTFNVNGWTDTLGDSSTTDCTGWSTTGLASGGICKVNTTIVCTVVSCAAGTQYAWCCSP